MARQPGVKRADFGGDIPKQLLIRIPSKRYEALGKLAFKGDTSVSYQINEGLRLFLVQAGLERETK